MLKLNNIFFKKQQEFPYLTKELNEIFSSISLVIKIIRRNTNNLKYTNIIGTTNKKNIQNEIQMKLDEYANKKFKDVFKYNKNIAGMASEEENEIVIFEKDRAKKSKYLILIDPIDGSSNIDINISIGTIFSIYKRITPIGISINENDFLQPGKNQIAAGYVIYGPSTILVYSIGCGVHELKYDESSKKFLLFKKKIIYPTKSTIYSINEGNYNNFSDNIKKYIEYCKNQDKKTGRPYALRYIGSLVADFHRNLIKGGIYIYPNTINHPNGKLRLLYECNPIAFLSEQANGKASNGNKRILDIIPNQLHQRTQLFVGMKPMVDKIEYFIKNTFII